MARTALKIGLLISEREPLVFSSTTTNLHEHLKGNTVDRRRSIERTETISNIFTSPVAKSKSYKDFKKSRIFINRLRGCYTYKLPNVHNTVLNLIKVCMFYLMVKWACEVLQLLLTLWVQYHELDKI
jgi:hypothetical protein